MTVSPDVSRYENLTLYDADPSTLVNRFVLNAQILIPGWNKQEGLTEMVAAQGLALIITELIYAVNRLPGATAMTLLQLFGIVPDLGIPATATVTFSVTTLTDVTIPAGTQMLLTVGDQNVMFTTDTDTAVTSADTTVTAAVTAATNTTACNGVAAGTQLSPVVQMYFVTRITLASSPTGGVNPETNDQWLDRGVGKLQGMSTTCVTVPQFTAAALNDVADGVFRATTIDQWDPTLSGGAGATSEGCVTVAVLGQGDVALTSGQKANLQALLEAGSVAGLDVFVVDPNVLTLPVACTVWQEAGYTVEQVQANVAAQLAASTDTGGAGLTTDQWPWTDIVRLNDLITVITQTPGVAFVSAMTSPTADVFVPGIAPLVELGTVTVTVEGP